MTEIPDSLRALFETPVEESDGRYIVPIPSELVEGGSLSEDERYRIALLASEATATPESDTATSESTTAAQSAESATDSPSTESTVTVSSEDSTPDASTGASSDGTGQDERSPDGEEESFDDHRAPPVEEGEVRTVSIDTLGDQGDGIARVERGFILIVPGTKPGDRVEVEVTDVKDTVAFADPIGEATVR